MLLIGSRLQHTPVMSLQTGTRLGHTIRPLIDPSNLRIVAYEIDGPLLAEKPSFLRTAEIREYGRLGMIINSNDDLISLDEVIQIQKLHELNFSLIGLQVIDNHKHRLGKVDDYTLDTSDFVIQQLNVKRGLFKSITDTGLLIDRSQIVEINATSIIVKAPSVKSAEPIMQSIRNDFVNPFRRPTQQADPDTLSKS